MRKRRSRLSRRLLGWLRTQVGTPLVGASLTRREAEVARLTGQGLTNREIGRQLGISDRTVGSHVQIILNKLGGANRAQIAACSARHRHEQMVTAVHVMPAAAEADRVYAAHRAGCGRRWRMALLAVASVIAALLMPVDHLLHAPETGVPHGALISEVQFAPTAMSSPGASRLTIRGAATSDLQTAESSTRPCSREHGRATPCSALRDRILSAEYEISALKSSYVRLWVSRSAISR